MAEPASAREHLYGIEVHPLDGPSREDAPPCPVCGGERATPVFGASGLEMQVLVCDGCGLGRADPMPTPAQIAAFYPPAYYGDTESKFQGVVEWLVRAVGARHIRFLSSGLSPGDRVLDVGCGRGVVLGPLADQGLDVHGVEISEDAVRGADPRAQIRIADSLAAAAYPDGFFQQVVVWHVLEHLHDPREALEEIHRVLAPGGRLVVAVPNFASLQAQWLGAAWFHLDLPRHLFHFPLDALVRLLDETGFEALSEHHFSLRQNPFGWIQSLVNAVGGLPRNAIYGLLHQRARGEPAPFSLATRLLSYGLLVALAPLGTGLTIVETVLRRGGTIHVVASRRG